ncbi:MAG TPA: hypothetical protein VI461_15965 [Chitinophagaceae bacterium]|nr:hypothetical protein [Chitinophagaceae bacterium]
MRISTLLLLFAIYSFSAKSQSWKVTGHYNLGLPRHDMEKNIQPDHGLQAGLMYQLPGKMKQLLVGIELGLGAYASKRIEQTFQFDNNTASVVPVNYNSNTFNANIQTRLNLLSDKNFIVPYISAKGGLYNFFSTIVVEDPDDPDGCHALERKNIMNDKTLYWSAGAGFQVDPALFNKRKEKGNVLIDISVNTVRGGSLNYVNTKHLIDAQTMNDPEGKPLQVHFVNASTQAIHEHTVAQVFTSPLRLLEIRAGVTVLLGW